MNSTNDITTDGVDLNKLIMSDSNIFSAIYSLESYIFEKNLLNKKDLDLYYKLQDKYDDTTIKNTIKACRSKLETVLTKDDYFGVEVYFKIKKIEGDKIKFRPLHTADLITQICIVSMLNVIMFSKNKNGKRQLSDVSQLLPSNFYGNLPSAEYENIFCDWRVMYKKYTDDIIREYELIKNNNSYKYEVTLDLKNFFPSVNPDFIYNFIMDKIGHIYSKSNKEKLENILKKLLYFKVLNLNDQRDINEYFVDSETYTGCIPKVGSEIMNIGIPQGLPQAYFFGNIAMIPISYEFNKMFPGKSFYYVDDSVIYTNSDNAELVNFKESLKKLNDNINYNINNYIKTNNNTNAVIKKTINYKVLVHENEKSYSALVDSTIKMSKIFLGGVGLEASRVAFEINDTLTENQDTSILEKIVKMCDALNIEITNVKKYIESESLKNTDNSESIDSFKIYLKSLIRYKKFFAYRKRILEFRKLEDINNIKKEFKDNFLFKKEGSVGKINAEEIRIKFFEIYDESIFMPEAALLISVMNKNEKNEFVKEIKKFDDILSDLSLNVRYFNRCFSNIIDIVDFRYCSLKKVAMVKLGSFIKTPEKIIKEQFKLIISHNNDIWLGYNEHTYNCEIFKYSNTYRRLILNSYISQILNIDFSDQVEIVKLDKRPLKYYELRILTYIRNKYIPIEDFFSFMNSIFNNMIENSYEKVDFQLVEVLDIFKVHVRRADLIDNLILVHKYVSGIWKNGSRFLYFYTLHNQEHSVELIKSSLNICKMFDFFQISYMDYYILFLACYLHDISMVIQPDINCFLENNIDSDEAYSSFLKFKQELNSNNNNSEFIFDNKQKIKKLMSDAFVRVNYYFESLARDSHVLSSAKYVRNSCDLNFLSNVERGIVSDVCAAHGANCVDVYGLRSSLNYSDVNVKHIMIILRLADLMDIAKERVSLSILDNNIKNMPEISQYHWVTHSAIDKFEITSKYDLKIHERNDDSYFQSVLKRENFLETIIVQIDLNVSNLTSVTDNKCKNTSSKLIMDKKQIEIIVDSENTTCKGKCNFLCKWICHKNLYLLDELYSIKQYIDRVPNLNYTTDIKIILNFENAKPLKREYFDIVNSQIH